MKKVLITKFEKWFFRLVGFSPYTIERTSEAEKQRILSLALILIVPVSIGVVSAGYAAYFLTQSPFSWLVGFLWGGAILIIDRSIVSMQNKGFGIYALRFLIAVIVGLVISFPLKLLIFQDVIVKHQTDILRKEKDDLVSQNKTVLEKLEAKYILSRERTYKAMGDYLDELSGAGEKATKLRGAGPVYLKKLESYNLLKKQEAQDSTDFYNKSAELKSNLDVDYSNISTAQANGLMGMYAALNEIAEQNPLIRFASYLIWAFLTLLELLPVLVKIQNKEGLYEDVLILDNNSILELVLETNKLKVASESSKAEIPYVQVFNEARLERAQSIIETELNLARNYSAAIVEMTKEESNLTQTIFSMQLKETKLNSILDKITSIFTKYSDALHEKSIKISPEDII